MKSGVLYNNMGGLDEEYIKDFERLAIVCEIEESEELKMG